MILRKGKETRKLENYSWGGGKETGKLESDLHVRESNSLIHWEVEGK